MNSDPSMTCPKCGTTLTADSPESLCPNCLLASVMAPTEPAESEAAPTLEAVAAAFPQLEIDSLIGRGGMGAVYKARQPHLDRWVALKVLSSGLASDKAFADRFTREARVLAKLNHPNIVTLHDFGQAGDYFFLLMEYVDGVNLRQAMRTGKFTPEQALSVVPKICEALQYAHSEGILHRDIKPDNILLDSRGNLKIADFGIAKVVGTEADPFSTSSSSGAVTALTHASTSLGTPQYMAPEQVTDPNKVDHRADIYSLGVVFYEMLTGELPTGEFVPPSQVSQVDARIDAVVQRALEQEREQRQQSADEVRTQVETIVRTPPPAPPAGAIHSENRCRKGSRPRRLQSHLTAASNVRSQFAPSETRRS